MFTKETTTTRTEFIDRHGDKIGFCELSIIEKEDGGEFYGVIHTELPKYTEYTTWKDLGEARFYYAKDIDEYTKMYADI